MSALASLQVNEYYQSLTPEKQHEYFHFKQQKFIQELDNIYYSIFIRDDTSKENHALGGLFSHLDLLKQKVREEHIEQALTDSLNVTLNTHARGKYNYCLSAPDLFDIYLASSLPNSDTPRIHIQIRSMGIWTRGASAMVQESYTIATNLLALYGLTPSHVQENRIDYAYHTNIIQSPRKFLNDRTLTKTLDTTMEKGSTVFDIKKSKDKSKGHSEIKHSYLSLGQRSSNNVFIRIYDKTLEVTDNGYKAYFLQLWYDNKLISYYDYVILLMCYLERDENYKHQAKLRFYIEHGTDPELIERYTQALANNKLTKADYKKLADWMPDTTTVMNVEFQTMRKFYYYSDEAIDSALFETERNDIDPILKRLFKIVDNRAIFLDYLTSKTLAFKKQGTDDYASWWKRLRGTKLQGLKADTKLLRDYTFEVNKEVVKIKLLNNLATLSVHQGLHNKKDFEENLADMMTEINDNHKNRYYQNQDKQYIRLKNRIKKADETSAQG